MKLFSLVLAVALLVAACSSKKPVSILQREYLMPIVIYPLGEERIDNATITRKALEILPDFRNYDAIPDSVVNDGYQLVMTNVSDSSYIPPQVFLIAEEYLLMTRAELDEMANADRNIQIVFFGTTENLLNKQAAIARFIGEITRNKKVAVVDFSSRQVYNLDAWDSVRTESFQKPPVNINDHIIFHSYRDGEYCRIVSLGLNKFGLPELVLNNIACSDQQNFGMIMNALAQSIFEDPNINADSTRTLDISKIKNATVRQMLEVKDPKVKGKAEVRLRSVPPQEGDNLYYHLELAFVNKEFGSPQEEQMALANDLVGVQEDNAQQTEHDEELLAASEHAKQRLPELKKMFNDGLGLNGSILVKSPFARQDIEGNEWMWVEVTKWTDDTMEGILQNEPNFIEGLAVGSAVTIKESEIFDYILYKADGSMEGNETGKILEQRMGNH